jgi:superfamily I DNA/RNA helicase
LPHDIAVQRFTGDEAGGQESVPAVSEWLRSGEEDAPPEALVTLFENLSLKAETLGPALAPLGAATAADRLRFLLGATGAAEPLEALRSVFALPVDTRTWADHLTASVKAGGKPAVEAVVAWLTSSDPLVTAAPVDLLLLMKNVSAATWKAFVQADAASGRGAEVWTGFTNSAEAICQRIRDRAGVASARAFLLDHLEPTIPVAYWDAHLARQANTVGRPLAGSVAQWLSTGDEAPAPGALVGYLGDLRDDKRKEVFGHFFRHDEPSQEVVFEVKIGGGPVLFGLSNLATKLPSRAMARATEIESVRADLDDLQRTVNRVALERIAREGQLDYDDLLAAAIALCETASSHEGHPLRTRFRALLVDEVQDSSPAQVTLYGRLLGLREDMAAFFVGDVRQSIYLFRGAEPNSIHEIAAMCDGTEKKLLENWRSVGELVTAQKSLFDSRLSKVMKAEALEQLESLKRLKSGKGDAGLTSPPVTLVLPLAGEKVVPTQANLCALREFANRIEEAWEALREAHGDDQAIPADERPTAVVLAPTWTLATQASEVLRGWLGPDKVHLDGGGGWRHSRVVRDLRILLAALTDRGNQLAWLGLWKLPMVGLSDGALALMRQHKGFVDSDEAPWLRHLGWSLEADGLEGPHTQADVAAFARARPALRTAARDLGHRPTAEVLERLAAALRWREVLAASPQVDALAHLDLALEWIRSLDEAGQPPGELLDRLDAGSRAQDLPRLELTRPPLHVSCTTLFQAKGLQWDHVCVMNVGASPQGGGGQWGDPEVQGEATELTIAAGDGAPESFRLLPVRLDLDGALEPTRGPIGHLAGVIDKRRESAEELRMAYVAITRAKRSVTLGLPSSSPKGVQSLLMAAWSRGGDPDQDPLEQVKVVPWYEADIVGARPMHHVVPGDDWSTGAASGPAWDKQAPSGVGNALVKEARLALATDVANRVLDAGTWDTCDAELVSRDTLPDDRVSARDLGSIVHGWFAVWGFRGAASAADVRAYLAADWGLLDGLHAPLADIVLAICRTVSAHTTSPLWTLVTRPKVQLHFELPLLGLSTLNRSEVPLLLGGRIDLLVRDPAAAPRERWTVVDFKAGARHPVDVGGASREERLAELVREGNLRSYGAQLEAYREAVDGALEAAGSDERVGRTALWFVRKGTSVIWPSAARADTPTG